MSKQYIADMLKSIASGDMDAAKDHFSKYSTEKSQEILSRGDQPEEVEAEVVPVEEPAAEPAEPTAEDDSNTVEEPVTPEENDDTAK